MNHSIHQKILFFLLISTLGAKSLDAQISLAPTSLFINDKTGVGSIYVANNSQKAQEANVSVEFGYPGADSLGNMTMVYNDSIRAAAKDIGPNMRVFPRQFVLQAGQSQTVRIQVRPLTGKPDGVYFTRVIITSNEVSTDVGADTVRTTIGTRITYKLKQNIPAFYSKGKVTTGLTPGTVTTSVEKGKLIAVSKLTPTGNAPFNGSVTVRLLNNSGKEIVKQQQTLVAYFEVLRRVELSLPSDGMTPGKYTLEFTYETQRADISPDDLVQAKPVKNSIPVEIK